MLAVKVIWLAFIAVVFVNGCHHNKEDVPPDTFPEEGCGPDGCQSRRKRSTTAQSDVDKKISDFFTICMFEKTGSVYNSWRSVIDFVLRDTRWYTATDFQYCKENADFDPKAVSCWQNRVKSLVKLDSKLLPKAQECIEEYQWEYEDLPIRRGKRSVGSTSYSITGFDTCLGVSIIQYGQCVQGQLITKQNLLNYPSLRNYDVKSVEKFVENEFTDCRIQSRSTFYGNIYTETCPKKYLQFITKPKNTCLSSIFREVVRTSSPLYAATKTCINKYSTDKCKYVNCLRPHQECDKNTGLCVCKDGYQQNFRGDCELMDKCSRVYCNRPNEICDPNTGNCVCQSGYERDGRGICAMDRCSRIWCAGANEVCDPNTGICVCKQGYKKDARGICSFDGCSRIYCTGANEVCESGTCVCKSGYNRDASGICTMDRCSRVYCNRPNEMCDPNTGRCVCKSEYQKDSRGICKMDKCKRVVCTGRFEICDPNTGRCVCSPGYSRDIYWICKKIDPCATVRCQKNMECTIDPLSGASKCVCKSGYVDDPNRPGCMKKGPCYGVSCPENSRCVNGDCICHSGYTKNHKNICVIKDPCSRKTCNVNMECIVMQSLNLGICVCKPGYTPHAGQCKKKDPCDGINCPPYSDCVQGTCVCRAGYKKNKDGICIKIDPCSTKTCDKNMECKVVRSRAICVCLPGYVPDPDNGGCKQKGCEPRNCGIVPLCFRPNCPAYPDATCKASNCDCREWYEDADGNKVDCTEIDVCEDFCDTPAEECFIVHGNPNCRCAKGFSLNHIGQCVGTDPCQNLQCESNMMCDAGVCICIPDFMPNPKGPGCIKRVIDPCLGKNCPPFSDCVSGECVCHSGYKKQQEFCIKIDACETMKCGKNMLCDSGRCVCIPGFVPSPNRPECIRKVVDSCAGKRCPQFSDCVGGDCVCHPGYRMRNNICIISGTDPCISGSLKCGPNMDCKQGKCSCKPGFTPASHGRPGCVRRVVDGGCPSSKVPKRCPTKCPKHCDNRGIEIACQSGCREGVTCVCKEGMIERNAKNTTCILPEHCPGLCWPNPCKHGGKCYPVGAYYICQCKDGYAGKSCELGCGEYCKPNGQCTRGSCVCNRGYVADGKGGCIRA